MNAVMYGAGNVGRGFVGALMSQSGYQVRFVDVDTALVDRLNAAGRYTLRLVDNEGSRDTLVENVGAIDGRDAEAVARAVADCSLMATAVGARVLPHIAPFIARGLRLRFQQGAAPLNILICENLMDASRVLEGLIKQHLTLDEQAVLDCTVGLVEASIGRMIPLQTEEMRRGNPLRVCAEPYAFLPVDRDALKGNIPPLQGLVPYAPFTYCLQRKLWLHNLGHACCAYLGLFAGKSMIWETVRNETIRQLAREAMLESAAALSGAHGVPIRDLLTHLDDLLRRFGNRALGDTCARVGADIRRKMAPEDRLIGAARLCLEQGIPPVHIALGAAAALWQFLREESLDPDDATARAALRTLTSLPPEDPLSGLILGFLPALRQGASPRELLARTREEKHRQTGPVM